MFARRLFMLFTLALPAGLGADARTSPWAEFLAPVKLVCFGDVVASRIVDHPSTLSHTLPSGEVVTPLQTFMTSTLRVRKSLRGDCPPVIELKWEVPIPFPAYDLDLDHVRSEWVVFLESAFQEAGQTVPAFEVRPKQAWKREHLRFPTGKFISAYHPQHIRVPEEILQTATIQIFYRGATFELEDRFVPEDRLFAHLGSSN